MVCFVGQIRISGASFGISMFSKISHQNCSKISYRNREIACYLLLDTVSSRAGNSWLEARKKATFCCVMLVGNSGRRVDLRVACTERPAAASYSIVRGMTAGQAGSPVL
jgi:hypothetical protein